MRGLTAEERAVLENAAEYYAMVDASGSLTLTGRPTTPLIPREFSA